MNSTKWVSHPVRCHETGEHQTALTLTLKLISGSVSSTPSILVTSYSAIRMNRRGRFAAGHATSSAMPPSTSSLSGYCEIILF